MSALPRMFVCAAAVAICGFVPPGAALAGSAPPAGLFARVECVSIVPSQNKITVHFGVDNQTQSEIVDPAINVIRPRKFIHPKVFAPGYTPDMFDPVFSTVGNPLIIWVLGDEDNVVKLKYPYTKAVYGIGVGAPAVDVPSCR